MFRSVPQTDAPAAEPTHERHPLVTWGLRSLVLALMVAGFTAAGAGWAAERRSLIVPGGIGIGLTTLAGWVIDGIELRRGVEKKGMAALPPAARVGLWAIVTGVIAVLLIVLGGLVGAVVGLVKDQDWPATAWRGARGGGILGGGLLVVGVAVFGTQWLVAKLLPEPPKGPNGRWISIEARANATWQRAFAAGAAAAVLLAAFAGADGAPQWPRWAGLALGGLAVALLLLAVRRSTRPGALRLERLGGA